MLKKIKEYFTKVVEVEKIVFVADKTGEVNLTNLIGVYHNYSIGVINEMFYKVVEGKIVYHTDWHREITDNKNYCKPIKVFYDRPSAEAWVCSELKKLQNQLNCN